jgi:antitoxin VapB
MWAIHVSGIYREEVAVSDTAIGKLFIHGRSQAVRLPSTFRLPGDRVRVRRVAGGILLEPMATDIVAWFAELDRFANVPFMEDGRRQPPMPGPKPIWSAPTRP